MTPEDLKWEIEGIKNTQQPYWYFTMQLRNIFLIFSLSYSLVGSAQEKVLDWTEYITIINRADSLYTQAKFYEAAKEYSNAFRVNSEGYSHGDKYKAARAWARSGQFDSAVSNLKQEVESGFSEARKLKKEESFVPIHKSKQWKSIINEVVENEKKEIAKLGKYKKVKARLEEAFVLDQQYRNRYKQTIDSFGMKSKEMNELIKRMKDADQKNLKYVSRIIDKYGWISSDTIGIAGSNTLFMIIQHADSSTQEKYFPIMREAVKQKKAFSNQLAMLEDRILLRRGSKQIYGTQVRWSDATKGWELSQIEDEKNVDKRRAEVGLQPLKDYLKIFNIEYVPQQ